MNTMCMKSSFILRVAVSAAARRCACCLSFLFFPLPFTMWPWLNQPFTMWPWLNQPFILCHIFCAGMGPLQLDVVLVFTYFQRRPLDFRREWSNKNRSMWKTSTETYFLRLPSSPTVAQSPAECSAGCLIYDGVLRRWRNHRSCIINASFHGTLLQLYLKKNVGWVILCEKKIYFWADPWW